MYVRQPFLYMDPHYYRILQSNKYHDILLVLYCLSGTGFDTVLSQESIIRTVPVIIIIYIKPHLVF